MLSSKLGYRTDRVVAYPVGRRSRSGARSKDFYCIEGDPGESDTSPQLATNVTVAVRFIPKVGPREVHVGGIATAACVTSRE